ncbi:MAG: hypothetical protein R3E79_29355 [Caldilineaceae bacterium]
MARLPAPVSMLEAEPPAADDPICTLPNVLCYPHIGSGHRNPPPPCANWRCKNLLAVLAIQRPPAPVSPEVLR